MPSLRQTSSTPPPASTSLTASTICSSVYLLLRMGPPSRGLTHQTVQFPGGRSPDIQNSSIRQHELRHPVSVCELFSGSNRGTREDMFRDELQKLAAIRKPCLGRDRNSD